jgi:hypothetical protein
VYGADGLRRHHLSLLNSQEITMESRHCKHDDAWLREHATKRRQAARTAIWRRKVKREA